MIWVFSWCPLLKSKFLRKMDVKNWLPASRCSNQSLTGDPDTSFPDELCSQLRWTSKHHSAGRLRWTSNRAKLPFAKSNAGVRSIGPASFIYKDRKSRQEAQNLDGTGPKTFNLDIATKVQATLVIKKWCATRRLSRQHCAERRPPAAGAITNGMFILEYSPLDSPISFPVTVRSGAETLKVICEAVTNASGRRVGEGLAPKLLFNTVVEVGAGHETARDVQSRSERSTLLADQAS